MKKKKRDEEDDDRTVEQSWDEFAVPSPRVIDIRTVIASLVS